MLFLCDIHVLQDSYFDFEFNIQEHSNLNFLSDVFLHRKKLQLEYQKEQVWSETLVREHSALLRMNRSSLALLVWKDPHTGLKLHRMK